MKLNQLLASKLATFDEAYQVFADSLSEDEFKAAGMKYFIYANGDYSTPEDSSDEYSMSQEVDVIWVSENREFVDGDILDIAALIKGAALKITAIQKEHRQLENQDRFIDIATFTCSRLIKVGC